MSVIIQGLLVGIIFGVVLQRSRLCFNSAIRDVKFSHDNYLMKMALVGILIETIGFQAAAQFGWIKLSPIAFIPAAQIVGGFFFGMGMVLAGGCASGITYRIGEGYVTALVAAVFFGVTGAAVRGGALSFVTKWFGTAITTTNNPGGVYSANNGAVNLTIASWLNINPWIIAIIFAVILLAVILFTKTTERKVSGLNWVWGGVAVGVVGIIGYLSQKTYALGITGGWINLFRATTGSLDPTKPVPYNWIGMLVFGLIIGSFIAALLSKEFKLRLPKHPKTFATVALGGIFMGFGAGVAGGCNIGHIFSGLPHLAISSIVATIFFVLGDWFMYWWLFERQTSKRS
ncbi:MAG TPA: YeeE/YedE family protein [Candidatus Deferrimicrobium sp.]|nr:YeeE/YedE family protein [Candidatus Deferrimicrobium sp.]